LASLIWWIGSYVYEEHDAFVCVKGVVLFLKTEAGGLAETVRTCQTTRVISLETEISVGRQENFRSDKEFRVEIYLSRLIFEM
jgi:hypothetical protein